MKKINVLLLLFISLFFLSTTIQANAASSITEIAGAKYYTEEIVEENRLGYGVTHSLNKGYTATSMTGYDVDGFGGQNGFVEAGKFYPQQVNVLQVPSTSGTKIVNWANLNNHKWTLTTVRNLIADYEAKHEGWRVVAAINGDFFDIGAKGNLPYQTSGAVVNDGEFYKTSSGGTIGFTNDGSVNSLIGNAAPTKTQYMKLAVYDENDEIIKEFDIQQINAAPGDNETAVYFATYDSTKTIIPVEVTSNGYFVDEAELALPNNPNDFYGKGTISSLEAKTITRGQFAIVSNNPEVNEALAVGVKIRTQYEYTGAYENVDTLAGVSSAYIMKNGTVNTKGLTDRAPRTVIGRKADGTIVMMVVDGRQSNIGMYGADRTELAAIMASYGAVDAYNLDGGGSSTMVIRQDDGELKVMNSPSDGRERTDSNALLIVTREPEMNYEVVERTTDSITIRADITEAYTHKIDKLQIRLNYKTVDVVDGLVTFTDLQPGNEYKVDFYYKNTSGITYQIETSTTEWTYKRAPYFTKVELIEDATSFTFLPNVVDLDNATNLLTADIYINDTKYNFVDGMLILQKSEVASISDVVLVYTLDIGDGNVETITILNPLLSPILVLNFVVDTQHQFVSDIYN